MLTLMLLRHAKAVQHGRGNDIARQLTEIGERDARRLGAHMAGLGLLPDLALVSSSARTRRTFELFAEAAGATIAARVEDSLYNATDRQLRDVLKLIDPRQRAPMIVGHNPGMMDVAGLLARDGDVADLTRLRSRFPPGALALISFATDDWLDARASGGRLDLLLLPEDIPAG